MKKMSTKKSLLTSIGLTFLVTACGASLTSGEKKSVAVPADKFDLSHWKITMPFDLDKNGKIDEVDVKELQTYAHSNFFYLDENDHMVFTVANKASTTGNSSNTRSELRQMLRGTNKKIKTKQPGNNFALAKKPDADTYAAIGGKMNATLKVNAVSLRAGYPEKRPAHSVVVGQIHAGKDSALINEGNGFGWGNEPIKIYYKKLPHHDKGSVFWNYERNLAKKDVNRTDIAYPVWGNTWDNLDDPGADGISLGEEFSYEINVYENTMHLVFQSKGHPEVKYSINLSDNTDAYGNVDELDNPEGYTGDWHYFKAGAYNQCSTKDAPAFWYTNCPGTGNWATDKANGDYTSVTFTKLVLSDATAPIK